MPSRGRQRTDGDHFSFGDGSIPITELGGEHAYGIAFGVRSESGAIATYQKEVLDLLNDVPEYVCELSFRDLVELPRTAKPGQDSLARSQKGKSSASGEKEKAKKGKSSSCESIGFIWNVLLSTPSSRRRRIGGNDSNRSVAPLLMDGGKGCAEKSKWLQRQELAKLKKDASKKPGGCCQLFHSSKSKSNRI